MADNKLVAEVRTNFGKGAARKFRAAGKTPAVIYGHGSEPRHITLPAHEIALVLRHKNALIDLDIAGSAINPVRMVVKVMPSWALERWVAVLFKALIELWSPFSPRSTRDSSSARSRLTRENSEATKNPVPMVRTAATASSSKSFT